jgi:hypothetical protein
MLTRRNVLLILGGLLIPELYLNGRELTSGAEKPQ